MKTEISISRVLFFPVDNEPYFTDDDLVKYFAYRLVLNFSKYPSCATYSLKKKAFVNLNWKIFDKLSDYAEHKSEWSKTDVTDDRWALIFELEGITYLATLGLNLGFVFHVEDLNSNNMHDLGEISDSSCLVINKQYKDGFS